MVNGLSFTLWEPCPLIPAALPGNGDSIHVIGVWGKAKSYQSGVYPDPITRALVKSCITGKTHVNTDMNVRVEG